MSSEQRPLLTDKFDLSSNPHTQIIMATVIETIDELIREGWQVKDALKRP